MTTYYIEMQATYNLTIEAENEDEAEDLAREAAGQGFSGPDGYVTIYGNVLVEEWDQDDDEETEDA